MQGEGCRVIVGRPQTKMETVVWTKQPRLTRDLHLHRHHKVVTVGLAGDNSKRKKNILFADTASQNFLIYIYEQVIGNKTFVSGTTKIVQYKQNQTIISLILNFYYLFEQNQNCILNAS